MNVRFVFVLIAGCCSGSHLRGQANPPAPVDEQVIIHRIQDLEKEPRNPFSPAPLQMAAAKKLFYQLDPASYGSAARQLIKSYENQGYVDYVLLGTWIGRDPKAAFEFLQVTAPKWLGCSLGNDLFERWAVIDPAAALVAAKNVSVDRKGMILSVLAVIAADSPGRALELLPDEESRQYGFANDVLAHWVGKSPDDAVKWAMAQPKRNQILWTLGFMWVQRDRPQAEAWVSRLRGDDHTCALAGMIQERAMMYSKHPGDPVLAAREFTAAFPDAVLNQDTIPNQTVKELAFAIANRLAARRSTFDGLAWVLSFVPSPGRDEMFDTVIRNWIKTGPAEALPYVEAMEPGPRKDIALASYVRDCWKEDPLVNFKLASAIHEESIRAGALAEVFKQWLLKSPEQAVQALHDLPDAQGTEVRALILNYAKSLQRQTRMKD